MPSAASGEIMAVMRVWGSNRVVAVGIHSCLPSEQRTIIHPGGSFSNRFRAAMGLHLVW